MRCRRTQGLLLLLLAVGSGSCSVNDVVGEVTPSPAPSANAAYCARSGPAWLLDVQTGRESCGGHLAARAFTRALCSCGPLTASASFDTDTLGGSGAEASVWMGGDFITNAWARIGGSLHVDGPGGIEVGAGLSVAGALRSLGPLLKPGAAVSVGGDAWVAGAVALRRLTVGGFLHQPEGSPLSVSEGFPAAQVLYGSAGPAESRCVCDSREDVAAYVEGNAPLHQNDVIGLDPAAFADVSNATRTQALPCGRFFLRGITGRGEDKGTVQLRVTGRTTLFVAGDVDVKSLEVRLAEGAELDLFIQGNLSASQRLVLDTNGQPSRLRIYVGGTSIGVPPELMLEANLYAPQAHVETGEDITLSGALVLGSFTVAGNFLLHYDPEVRTLARTCSDGG
jgi:hypothetical protein